MIERIIVLGGKGGVGKSTISAATAVALSDMLPDKKILLISFDIAHNISDLFTREVGDKLTRLTDNLWGIEPDPNVYAEEYTKEFHKKMRALMKRTPIVGQIPQIKNFIDTTMTADSIPLALKNSMFFQKILDADSSIYRDRHVEAIDFDIVVADFPPTGNMITLFEIPEDQIRVLLKYSLNFFNSIRGAIKKFQSTMIKPIAKLIIPVSGEDTRREIGKEVFKMLHDMEERGTRISELIHNKGSLRLVTIAEKPSFEEIKRARDLSEKYITLDGVHINMLTPEKSAKKCEYCGKMHDLQHKYMSDIKQEFDYLKIWESHKLQDEPIGLDGLRRLAREVYGDITAGDILNPKK